MKNKFLRFLGCFFLYCSLFIPTVTGQCPSLTITTDQPSSQIICTDNQTIPIDFSGTGDSYTWTNDRPDIGIAANGAGNIPVFTAINDGTNPITATFTVTPKKVEVFAYLPQGDSIIVVNTVDNTVAESIFIGGQLGELVVSPDGSTIYAITPYYVVAINTADNTIIQSILVGTFSHTLNNIAISPDGSNVYVTKFNDQHLFVINTTDNTVTESVPFDGSEPGDLVVSPDGSKLYIAYSNKVIVMNTADNTTSQSIFGVSGNLAVSPDGSKLFVTTNTGLKVINTTDDNPIPENIDGGPFGHLAVSPDGSKLYATTTTGVTIINTTDNTEAGSVYFDRKLFPMSYPVRLTEPLSKYLAHQNQRMDNGKKEKKSLLSLLKPI